MISAHLIFKVLMASMAHISPRIQKRIARDDPPNKVSFHS